MENFDEIKEHSYAYSAIGWLILNDFPSACQIYPKMMRWIALELAILISLNTSVVIHLCYPKTEETLKSPGCAWTEKKYFPWNYHPWNQFLSVLIGLQLMIFTSVQQQTISMVHRWKLLLWPFSFVRFLSFTSVMKLLGVVDCSPSEGATGSASVIVKN